MEGWGERLEGEEKVYNNVCTFTGELNEEFE